MWVLFLILGALQAYECDATKNEVDTNLNPDCNNVGICKTYLPGVSLCSCCDTSTSINNDPCNGATESFSPGKWNDGDIPCDKPSTFVKYEFGILVPEGLVTCPDDGTSASTPDLLEEVNSVTLSNNYSGIILAFECQICTSGNPCDLRESSYPDQTEGVLLNFGTDLNTYYDHNCALSSNTLPLAARACDLNLDYGAEAKRVMFNTLNSTYGYSSFRDSVMEEIDNFDWSSNGPITYMYDVVKFSTGSTHQITRQPTSSPSAQPTSSPSAPVDPPRDIPCLHYINFINDVEFLSAGVSCRARMNESWTGGRTCESPYIVCLPEENTPANDTMGDPYKSNTHRYTVDECRLECSYDQGCLGIEFRADFNSSAGSCMLLSIEPEVEGEDFLYKYDSNATNLYDQSNNQSLCWSKKNYCNPFSQAEDLTDEMLSCYCPNNRKGVYTKKVKRTVNNTRFCDNDSSVDERIRLAQANRMFHLCENWCLFETYNPEQENWYWDPWKQCWRETYSGRGVHRAYCDRVIRNPDSIELQFLNHRRAHFCDVTGQPTSSPVPDVNTTYYLAEVLESCDGVCGRNDKVCAAEQTTRRFKTEDEMDAAFAEAGVDCGRLLMNSTARVGWALPGLSARTCVNRQPTIHHLMDLDSDCRRTIGLGWRRLCACY